jgi:putative DNA primase/helicase
MDEFVNAMRDSGLTPPCRVIADGKMHRFMVGDERQKNGWYVLHSDPPAGAFGNWKTGMKEKWCTSRGYTEAEKTAFKREMEQSKIKREKEEEKLKDACRQIAEAIWAKASAINKHPYISRKQIQPVGVRMYKGAIVVPVRDSEGVLHGLQFIGADGTKKFLKGTAKKGCYFSMGNPNGKVCICEGYATGASIYQSTGIAVAVAFDAGNMAEVAKALQSKLKGKRFIICADNDQVGLSRAVDAAEAVKGHLVCPPNKGEDFNDVYVTRGSDHVARLFLI